MLEIKSNLDKQAVADCCRSCGEPYSEAFYLYQAVDRGEVLASGLFRVDSDAVSAVYYEALEEDAFLFDGILRAGLNYAAGQGLESGEIPDSFRLAHRELFEKLNYPPEIRFNIVNFFQKYKSCGPRP